MLAGDALLRGCCGRWMVDGGWWMLDLALDCSYQVLALYAQGVVDTGLHRHALGWAGEVDGNQAPAVFLMSLGIGFEERGRAGRDRGR